jgi:hypothetical protein
MVREVVPNAVSSSDSATTDKEQALTISVMSVVDALVNPIKTTGFERYVADAI